MPYIRESALHDINQAQHRALGWAEELEQLAAKIAAGNAEPRDARRLEPIIKSLNTFSAITTEPGRR